MSNLKISGVLHVKYDSERVSDKFTKREFVLKMQDGNYEQFGKFQLTQDRCELLDNWNEGDAVTVNFNIRGREHNGKYFSNLDAWKLEAANGAQATAPAASQAPAQSTPAAPTPDGQGKPPASDDLPF